MEIIIKELSEPFYLPKNFISLYKDIPFCIFDIETTGLNPNFNKVILVGLYYMKDNKMIIQQFLCDNRKKESQLLYHIGQNLSQFKLFISYNGDAFDIPFLNKRFDFYKMNYRIKSYKNLDLLQFAKKINHKLQLDNYKLKTLEKHLGIKRDDTISGKESIDLYNKFEKSLDPRLKKNILLHNYDDIYYMGKTLSILDKVSREEAAFYMPQYIKTHDEYIYIAEQKIKNNTLYITGYCENKDIFEYILYENAFSFNYTFPSFTVKIPLYEIISPNKIKQLCVIKNEFPFNIKNNFNNNDILTLGSEKTPDYAEIYHFTRLLIQYIFSKLFKK